MQDGPDFLLLRLLIRGQFYRAYVGSFLQFDTGVLGNISEGGFIFVKGCLYNTMISFSRSSSILSMPKT